MKCILMTRSGTPDVLQPAEIEKPHITSANEVLVRIHAAGVNPVGRQGIGAVFQVHPSLRRYRLTAATRGRYRLVLLRMYNQRLSLALTGC